MTLSLAVTLAVGLLGGGGIVGLVTLLANRRKTAAETNKTEAEGIKATAEAEALLKTAAAAAVSTLQTADAARINVLLGAQEAVLTNVQTELQRQRDLREADLKNLNAEIATWRERSAKCDEALASEIRIREHEKILARERDIAIFDLQKELTVAVSEVGRLVKRADEEDRHARRGGTAAMDMLRQVGVQMVEVKQGIDAVQDEVKTVNGTTMAMYADQAEVRRVLEIPVAERTPKEAETIVDVTEEGEAK